MGEKVTGNSTKTVSKRKQPWLEPFRFKPGTSGNPSGRPKGTLKDFARNYIKDLPDEEKIKYLNSIDKDLVWRMAEGNPKQESDVSVDKEGIAALTQFFRLAAKPIKKSK